jgi:Protein of unknown function (DUF3112)
MQMSAPYPPTHAGLGLTPSVGVDVPICAVFLLLFILGAAGHMFILLTNQRKGHKFLMSGLMFGFCMARNVTCIMRIVWACYPHNIKVAIAAQIFANAGVLVLFLINLIFAQRIVRAAHPHFGWHKAFHFTFLTVYLLILLILAAIITATVQSFYTRNPNTRRIDLDVQRATATYFMVISFLPLPIIFFGLVVPRTTRLQKFGSGRWRTKIWILLTSATLLCLGAAFRCGTQFKSPRPINHPAWYQNKWCFYFFYFTVEIIVVYLYVVVRVDRRFYIPDGSKAPGDYVRDKVGDRERKPESTHSVQRFLSEEEVFDDEPPEGEHHERDLEANGRSESE